MKRIYVAGNYSANNIIDCLKNIGKGQQACATLFTLGYYPFCPWHDKSYIIDNPYLEFNVEQFHQHSLAWLEVSDALYVISGKGKGGGVDAEIKRAKELGIPVFYEMENLICFEKGET